MQLYIYKSDEILEQTALSWVARLFDFVPYIGASNIYICVSRSFHVSTKHISMVFHSQNKNSHFQGHIANMNMILIR